MNERIDHNNYEAWLLDRLEGNLSPEQELELDAFLAVHPELAPGDDEFPSLIWISASLSQQDKDALKRFVPPTGDVSETSLDDHLIARLEGDLTPEQKLALEKYLYEHPEHANASRLYALTKLVPEAMAYAANKELERHLPPKGHPNRFTLEDHLVARMEDDLTADQEEALAAYLASDPAAQRAWAAMFAARIKGDHVAYPHKQRLKKGGRVISISFQRTALRLAAAASVAWFIGVGVWTIMQQPGPDAVFVDNSVLPQVEQPRPGHSVPANKPSTSESKEDGTMESSSSTPSVITTGPALVAPPTAGISGQRTEVPPQPQNPGNDVPQFAAVRRVSPNRPELAHIPVHVEVANVPISFLDEVAENTDASIDGDVANTSSVGSLVASAIREKVLSSPVEEARPLDDADAVAIVDKGLKKISGENAGLDVQRSNGGRIKNFNLRVGNFAVTASTGR